MLRVCFPLCMLEFYPSLPHSDWLQGPLSFLSEGSCELFPWQCKVGQTVEVTTALFCIKLYFHALTRTSTILTVYFCGFSQSEGTEQNHEISFGKCHDCTSSEAMSASF
jgi:hypothetical protein